jgi:hypothetical protein
VQPDAEHRRRLVSDDLRLLHEEPPLTWLYAAR